MHPLVTIAIPTLNRVGYLALALDSALAQHGVSFEVVVSDNASSDGTAAMLAGRDDPRLRVLRQQSRLTMVENWNQCVRAARGMYFLMLSDDDLLEPDAISALVEAIEQGPLPSESVGLACCRGRIVDQDGKHVSIAPAAPPHETAAEMILGFFASQRLPYACTLLFRHSDIAAGYTAELPLATDAAQWMQAVARRGHAVAVDRVLASYRVHRNLSALTPVADWQRDNLALAEFAIAVLERHGRGSATVAATVRSQVLRVNQAIVPQLLRQRHPDSRWKTVQAYVAHRNQFAGWSGARRMLRGLLGLFVPRVLGLPTRLQRLRQRSKRVD